MLGLAAGSAHAGSLGEGFCGRQAPLSAAQQDRLLRFAAVVREELEASGRRVALIARSGLDLSRFGQRYSHAGVTLADGAGSRWAVRQLYYACEEGRPRLFDQGLGAYVSGTDDPAAGHVAILLLPQAAAADLARTALDRPLALRLLAGTYRANAHAWDLQTQNCNQWVIELLAASAASLPEGPALRAEAQDWLRAAGYVPSAVDAGSHWLMFAAGFSPWLGLDHRPQAQRHSLLFHVSLPASIEAFVQRRWPQAERIELCHAGDRIVVRRGWTAIADGCTAAAGDRVLAL